MRWDLWEVKKMLSIPYDDVLEGEFLTWHLFCCRFLTPLGEVGDTATCYIIKEWHQHQQLLQMCLTADYYCSYWLVFLLVLTLSYYGLQCACLCVCWDFKCANYVKMCMFLSCCKQRGLYTKVFFVIGFLTVLTVLSNMFVQTTF